MKSSVQTAIQFYDYHPDAADFYSEVITGLQAEPKNIPPKFFYDEYGSRLFERICECPEYYPTRIEQQILQENADEIAAIIGKHAYIIEPGSGSCEKIRLLLDSLQPRAYVPLDISRDFLKQAADSVSQDYPWLEVCAACVDYTQPLMLPFAPQDVRKLAFFPGSSIGNFEPEHARTFLAQVAETVGAGGGILIGVDLKKQQEVLNLAYNDAAGVTAAFNLNLLTRVNNELGADFDLAEFEHQAFYNTSAGRIEMHLVSRCRQTVVIDSEQFEFAEGESIHTENSYKYTVAEFQRLASQAGFMPVYVWTDAREYFSVHYFEVPNC